MSLDIGSLPKSNSLRCSAHWRTRRSRFAQPPVAVLGFLQRKTEPTPVDQLPSSTSEWLRSRGLPPQKLVARDCGVEGRGLVASTMISAGESLLRVPRQLVLTAQDAAEQSQLSSAIEREGLPAWSVLALFLVECKLGQASPWQPYTRLLPASSNNVLEWSQNQVDSLLAGTRLLQDACDIRAAAELSWEQLQPVLQEQAAGAAFGGKRPSRSDFQWAFSMLLSRLIRLSSLNDVEALVPWVDLLNHSPAAETCIEWDGQSVVFRPHEALSPGQQVFASYGSRSSGALLLSYGFVPEGPNAHETVDIDLSLLEADPLYAAKVQTLNACGLDHSRSFPLRLGAFPDGLVQYAAILSAADSDGLRQAWSAQRDGEQRLDPSVRAAALRLVRQQCRDRIDAMQKGGSKPVDSTADPLRLEQLVAEVRTRELRILNRAVFLLTQMMKS